MLEIGKTNEVTFKIDVNGTAAAPAVKFILEAPNAEMGFTASNNGDSNWSANVAIPDDFKPGSYGFRIEVVVNNRLFTPVKKRVEVTEPTVISVSVPTPTQDLMGRLEAQTPAFPTQTKEQTRNWEGEGGSLKGVKEIPQPLHPAPTPPAPPVKEAKAAKASMRINIAEIVAESNKKFDKVLSESATYKKPVKTIKPINITPQTPVTLKKGEVVYE